MRPCRRLLLLLTLAMTVAGCSSIPPVNANSDRVVFETSPPPFCGSCDVLKLTVSREGQVWVEHGYWRGDYRRWRINRRYLRISPERTEAFLRTLERVKPVASTLISQDHPDCSEFFFDQGEIRISWWVSGSETNLIYDEGCNTSDGGRQARILRHAPAVLELKIPPAWIPAGYAVTTEQSLHEQR